MSRMVKEGDFILSNSMSFGRPYIMKTTGCIHDGWLLFREKEPEIDRDYLYYLLSSNTIYRKFKRSASGSTVKNLNTELVGEIEISYPTSLELQKRIVAKLDASHEINQKRKEIIKLLDEYTTSSFYELFGDPVSNEKKWQTKKLKDLTNKIGSGATPKGGKSSYLQKGIALIRSLNIHDNAFLYENLAFLSDSQADALSNVIVEQDDVLLNITGASVCRSAIVPVNILPARVNQHVSIIRVKKDILNPHFLLQLLISPTYKRKLLRDASSGGATREALTKSQIESLEIIVPPIEMQERFVKMVSEIKLLRDKMINQSEVLEAHFQSLMQSSFISS